MMWCFQNIIISVILLLGLISGGIASSTYASSTDDKLDEVGCYRIDDNPNLNPLFKRLLIEVCDETERLKKTLNDSAVSYN